MSTGAGSTDYVNLSDAEQVGAWNWPETCEDRGYECCDMFPPCTTDPDGELRADLTSDEYDLWYVLHLLAWRNR